MKAFFYILAVVLLQLSKTYALSQYCQNQLFCVTGGQDHSGNIFFTVHSSAMGWAAFGVGSSMGSSTMYVGYMNSTKGITLSTRDSTGHFNPSFSNDQTAALSSFGQYPAPSWAKLVFTVKRPSAMPSGNIVSSTTYLFGMSDTPPDSVDSPSSLLQYHTLRGVIRGLDLTTVAYIPISASINNTDSAPVNETQSAGFESAPGSPVSSATPILQLPKGAISYNDILRVHGIMMVVAWTISPAIGIFIARYLKDLLGVWWFRLHVFFMFFVTGFLTVAAIMLIVLYKTPPHFTDGAHRPFGLVIGAAMVIQIVLGIVCDRMFSPNRSAVPLWDKLHWFLGRILALAAAGNIVLGILLLQDMGMPLSLGLKIGYIVVAGCIVAAFVIGEIYLGQIRKS